MTPIPAGAVFVGRKGAGPRVITIAFGILERHGKVHTEIVPNAAKKPLQAAIPGQVILDSTIHSGGWMGYDGLVDRGYKKHFHVNHGQHEFTRVIALSMALDHSVHMQTKACKIQWCSTKNFSS